MVSVSVLASRQSQPSPVTEIEEAPSELAIISSTRFDLAKMPSPPVGIALHGSRSGHKMAD